MIDPQRRRILAGLTALTATAAVAPLLGRHWPAWGTHVAPPSTALAPTMGSTYQAFQQPLRIPGREGLLAEVSLSQPLALRAQVGTFAVFDGQHSALWHYAGTVAGRAIANPLLHARHGDEIDVSLDNRLSETTSLHWHGMAVDELNDGSGLHPVAAGAQTRYRYRVRNRAGLYWYHAHPHGRTGAQLQYGLAGLLLVEDEEERALREQLDLAWGVRDLPLMIADKQVDGDNAIVYRQGADDWIGNRMLINWTPEPYLEVVPGRYRLRMANVCNARMLRLAFVYDGQPLPMQLLGTDGGLLAQPWPIDDLFLAPAQRADVLLDFSGLTAGTQVMLRSLDFVAMENEDESGAFAPDPMGDHPGARAMGAALELMALRISGRATDVYRPLPQSLAKVAAPPDTHDWPVRPLHLRMTTEGQWLINDWNFHHSGHAPVFRVKRGSREVWEIRNGMTSMPHPIHVHGFMFRVVARSISPPDIRGRKVTAHGLGPQDLGWSDTVVVWPGEIVRIAIDFSQPYRGTQHYMLHCHNLEHEDMGMMVTFAVTD